MNWELFIASFGEGLLIVTGIAITIFAFVYISWYLINFGKDKSSSEEAQER